jgi:hypothetical protein
VVARTATRIGFAYWHWGIGILPLMSYGGRPPEGNADNFEAALVQFKVEFAEWHATIPPDTWRENLDYMRRGAESAGENERAARQAALRQQLGLLAKPDIIRPAVSIGLDVMRAAVIAAIDQHVAATGTAHLVEGDRLRVGRHRCGLVVTRPTLRPPAS